MSYHVTLPSLVLSVDWVVYGITVTYNLHHNPIVVMRITTYFDFDGSPSLMSFLWGQTFRSVP